MSFLDDLRGSRETPTTAYLLFLLNFSRTGNSIHAFFEGNDDSSFYINFINEYNTEQKKLYIYKCGNKQSVFETFEKLKNLSYSSMKLLYFVDKDLSDFFGDKSPVADNIYVTDFYSIENYLVNDIVLRRIWIDLFHLTDQDEQFEVIRNKFNIELARFYNYIRPIMAWMIFANNNNCKPNMNNVNLSKYFKFSEDLSLNCMIQNIFKELEMVCGTGKPPNKRKEMRIISRELEKIEPKKYIRGKFELWYLIKFLGNLTNILNNEFGTEKRIKIITSINEGNAIEILGPRVSIPQSLSIFLHKNIGGLVS